MGLDLRIKCDSNQQTWEAMSDLWQLCTILNLPASILVASYSQVSTCQKRSPLDFDCLPTRLAQICDRT